MTDSESEVRFDRENKPGIANLLEINAAATARTPDQVATGFQMFFGSGGGAYEGEFPVKRGELMPIELGLQYAGGTQTVDVVVLGEHAVSNVAFEDEHPAERIVADGSAGAGSREAEGAVDRWAE